MMRVYKYDICPRRENWFILLIILASAAWGFISGYVLMIILSLPVDFSQIIVGPDSESMGILEVTYIGLAGSAAILVGLLMALGVVHWLFKIESVEANSPTNSENTGSSEGGESR